MRDSYFDNAKFLLVVLVVLGHMALGPLMANDKSINALYIMIYFFHMPLFTFISGYFSKNFHKEGYYKKIFTRIFIPYIIFQTLYCVFHHFFLYPKEHIVTFGTPYYQLWFLLALAVWKFILPYFIKLKYPLLIAFALSIFIGYEVDIGAYLSLSRIFVFFPMFLLGYYFDKKWLDKLFLKSSKIISVLVLISVYLLIYYFGQDINKQIPIAMQSYDMMGYREWYAGIYRIGSFAVTFIISIAFLSLVPRKQSMMSELGKFTMYPYILHAFLVKYLNKIQFHTWIDTTFEKILWIVLCVGFVMLLSTKPVRTLFNFLVEPKLNWIFVKEKSARFKSVGKSA